MARKVGLDLVEVAAQERPPVCKIIDYGKCKFEQGRKKVKGQPHQLKLKEIRVRPKTEDRDIDTKVNQARKFLEHENRVQVYGIFRGREMKHMDEGRQVLDAVLEKLSEVGKEERSPLMEGKRMVVTLSPK
jgi:translation initiation factor IF-3